MQNNYFEQRIRNINWAKYLEPRYYNPNQMDYSPERLVKVLIWLIEFDESEAAFGLHNEILDALGNNHRGTYYPVVLEAIDLIIEIEKHSEIEEVRKSASAILNDLHYFQLELGNKDKQLFEEIDNAIRKKLKPYSDENMKFEKILI